jgi:integrase
MIFRGKNSYKLDDRRVLEALQGKVTTPLSETLPTPEGEIGFKDANTHSLRHYFVSEVYRNGATDAEFVEWLGHRDSQLLRIYCHLRPEDGHRKLQNINFLRRRTAEAEAYRVAFVLFF